MILAHPACSVLSIFLLLPFFFFSICAIHLLLHPCHSQKRTNDPTNGIFISAQSLPASLRFLGFGDRSPMARLGGMSSDSFPSPSAAGNINILRDPKSLVGSYAGNNTRASVLLGITNPPSTTHSHAAVVSCASSPVETSSVLDADIQSDEFHEEDIWGTEANSWKQDSSVEARSGASKEIGLNIGFHRQGSATDVDPGLSLRFGDHYFEYEFRSGEAKYKGDAEDPGIGISGDSKQHASVEVIRSFSSRRRSDTGFNGIADAVFSGGATGLRVSKSSLSRQSYSSSSWAIPQRNQDAIAIRWHTERQSAPVQIPVWSKMKAKSGMGIIANGVDSDDDKGDDERLPPHELVARENARSERTTFSVCEGQGRTLKGRDLSRVRNAVWSQTGFAD